MNVTVRSSRRQVVKGIATLCAGSAFARLGQMSVNAQSTGGYKALVCVFLFGGNDGNNTVVPLSGQPYQTYAQMRSGLALPATTLRAIGAAYGLHPRLAGLQRVWTQNRLAVVMNVGTLVRPATRAQVRSGQVALPRNLYSHSDQTTQWQTSNPAGSGGTGWGGRVNDALQGTNAATFPPGVSLSGAALFLNGMQARSINMTPGSFFGLEQFGSTAGKQARVQAMGQMLTFDNGVQLIGAANTILGSALRGAEEIERALNSAPALTTQFPNSGLGGQLAQVAKVIQSRAALGMNRQIFFCSQGGYDNHSDLVPSQDSQFATLDPALEAFWNSLGAMGVADNVTLFTESEFGRTGNPSTSAGSDHAWGSHHFVLGGAVRGGTYGTFPTLALQGPDDAGDRGLWIPTTSLDQYAATMASWFGVPDAQLNSIFPNLPNFATPKLSFL